MLGLPYHRKCSGFGGWRLNLSTWAGGQQVPTHFFQQRVVAGLCSCALLLLASGRLLKSLRSVPAPFDPAIPNQRRLSFGQHGRPRYQRNCSGNPDNLSRSRSCPSSLHPQPLAIHAWRFSAEAACAASSRSVLHLSLRYSGLWAGLPF